MVRNGHAVLLALLVLALSALQAAAVGPVVETSYDPSQVQIQSNGEYARLAIKGARHIKTPGEPALPVEYLSFVIPADMRVEDVVITWLEETQLPGTHRVIPAQPEVPTGETPPWVGPDPSIYEIDGTWPSARVEYLGDGYLGGYHIASVAVYPLTYAPTTGTLTLATNIGVELSLAADVDRSLPRHRMTARSDRTYREIVENLVANPHEVAGKLSGVDVVDDVGPEGFMPRYSPSLEGSPVEYIIITTDEFQSQFQELADWKTKKGVPTVVRTIDWIEANYPGGCDRAERIRLFIRDAFTSWGTTFVLLGGDTGHVPVRYAWSGYYGGWDISTDLYYSDLDGNWNADGDSKFGEAYISIATPGDSLDLYPDVFVGRAPVATPIEVETFIDKAFAYEKTPDLIFARRIAFLAEVLFPYDWTPGTYITTDGAGDIVEPLLHLIPHWIHYTRLYQNYEAYPGSYPLTHQSAIDSMNAGYNIVSHVGHGNKDVLRVSRGNYISPQDADALVNGVDKSGFFWMLNCSSTAIEYDCISEHFLNNPDGGGSLLFGPTRFCFPTTADEYFYDWFEELYVVGATQAGMTSANCKLDFIPASFYDNTDRWTQLSFLLLGDPEVRIWTHEPEMLTVIHDPSIPLGATDLTVSVSDPGAVEGALVCVVKEDEVYATGYTNGSGQVVLSFTPKTTGTMTIAVTAENHLPYEDTIGVSSSTGPHLTLRTIVVDDDDLGWSDGNGNGKAEAGEAIELDVTIGNGGQSGATNVTATLVDGDPYVTLIDNTHFLGTIPPGTELTYQDAFLLSISDDCPNEHDVALELVMDDGSRATWTSDYVLRVYRPELLQVWNDVDDGPGGNGVPGVGETIVLTIDVLNEGNGDADIVTGVLRYPGAEVTITDSTDTWGDIGEAGTVAGLGGFVFDVEAPFWGHFQLLLYDEDGKEWTSYFDLDRPLSLFGLEGHVRGTTIYLDWQLSEEFDLWGYNMYRTDHPAGTYQLANDGVVERISYFEDSGLAENTRYYYRVAAIDSSGNEGLLSATLEISTNPPSQAGWPLYAGEASYGTPALADLDLDGDLEILIGSGDVYCWHHNGVEYMDGDGDPRTNGIFTVDGAGGYRSSLAIGELDGDPYPEFIGASWGNFERGDYRVFAWNGDDGTLLDGWPRSTPDYCWSTPALGDLSGDGLHDVVIACDDGNLYAWDSYGQELIDGDDNPLTDGVFAFLGWEFAHGSPALADIDDDMDLEIIIGSRSESLYVFNADGTDVPGWPVWCGTIVAGSPCVADLDADGSSEIIVTANNGDMFVFSASGDTLPGWPIPMDIGGDFPPSPTVADLYGEGELVIIQPDEDGLVHVLTMDAEPVPGWPQPMDTAANSSAAVGDVDGDSHMDVVVTSTSGKVFAFSAIGELLDGWPIQTDAEIYATPTLGDLDLDGDMEVVVASQDVFVYIWDCDGNYAGGDGVEWASFGHDFQRTGNYDYEPLTGVAEDDGTVARVLSLEQNVPNPFNPITMIAYNVPADVSEIEVSVYNVAGRLVRTLVEGEVESGRGQVVWDGRDAAGEKVASGVYFVRLSAERASRTRKMVLLK